MVRAFILLALLLVGTASIRAQAKHQTFFVEQNFAHEVDLPSKAITALNNAIKKEDGKNWRGLCEFKASRVSLRGDSDVSYIVTPTNLACMGADNVHFWIVTLDAKRYRVVFGDDCSDVEILKSETNGFHNIRTFWGAGSNASTHLFQYRNGKYVLTRKWRRTIRPSDVEK